MSATPMSSQSKQKSRISNARSRKILTRLGPFDLSFLRQLCDPQENFAIERINLTSSTGFMVVWV
ncbi:hypothetical protein Q5692_04010 [Microcoleus sp. C2C3]|uniref:hypothetical protein n=1 Tax=unclassified Microcoleus TaxID=2642155 RepID=UPI002FCF11A0